LIAKLRLETSGVEDGDNVVAILHADKIGSRSTAATGLTTSKAAANSALTKVFIRFLRLEGRPPAPLHSGVFKRCNQATLTTAGPHEP
jgi:hypothetical protein